MTPKTWKIKLFEIVQGTPMLKTLIIKWCINSKTKTWDNIYEGFDEKHVRWISKFMTKYNWNNNNI